MRKITIEDISRDTGLSRGTVSRALNDRPDISTQTKQRVLEACRKLNYVPSHAARSLATGRNYAVAVLVEDLREAFAAGLVRGVIARASQERYAVHLVETGRDPKPEKLRVFSSERIDGALNAIHLDGPLASELRGVVENRVLVSCWQHRDVSCDVLTPDHVEAGRMVARFLLRNEMRRMLYVHRSAAEPGDQRLDGFQEICQEHGVDPAAATATVASPETLDELTPRLENTDAVIAGDDYLAVSIMLLCARIGRRPGEDLAIIGYGNEPVGSAIFPTLTTVDFDGVEVGRRMMDTLLQRIAQKRMDNPQLTRIAPLLIERATTQHLSQSG
jgi:DNA-binding LacI/PurR family transcriptional regulator